MKLITALSFFMFSIIVTGFSQSKAYFTSGGEMIFSFAAIEDNGNSESSIMRWSPFFNAQSMANLDLHENFGVFSGLAIRNVGFIYDHYKVNTGEKAFNEVTVKKKFRSYNLGIPVGIKVGNLDKMFIYGGYEVELPLHYKEKTFDDNNNKQKETYWFSNRMERIQHGLLFGIQFKQGANLKFKYYLSNFHNQDFVDRNGNRPYEGLKANVFYFSLCSDLFKNAKFNAPKTTPDKNT